MARSVLIDPPVGPYSPPEEIRAWIEELEERLEDVEEKEDRQAHREAIERAQRWMRESVG